MKVLIVPNYSRADAVEDARKLDAWLDEQGIEAKWAHDKKLFPNRVTDASDCGLVVSLGGDGTLLRAARIVGYAEVPMVGISYGHLGFLTTGGPEDLFSTVESALADELHVSHRATLDVESEFVRPDGSTYTVRSFALNDFAVSRGGRGDMVEFDVAVSGNRIDRLRGDGFVVSTATGSTGYALAAGGPIVTPEFTGMVCVPIAPHKIMARAFLTSPSDVVEIDMSPERPVERRFFADGQLVGSDDAGWATHASIRRGPGDILLLDRSAQSFYGSVSRVFYGSGALTMIDELTARNVALIKEASISPAPGLTVLTGETGAGKSALLSSIKLLVGERADAGAVREGADALEVEGRFYLRGGDPEGVVAARRVSADGRGRVRIDGRMGSVRELAEGVGATVDLCGQHEHQRLLQAKTHVDMLDAWAGDAVAGPLAVFREELRRADEAAAELERVRKLSRANAEALEEARFVLARVDEVDPREGELEEIDAKLPRAEHAESLLRSALSARGALASDGGALDAVREAAGELRGASRLDPTLAKHADVLKSALLDLEDVAAELRDYSDELDFDPAELERMQERRSAIQGLLRAYGPTVKDVLSRRDAAREVVEAASDGGEARRRAKKAYVLSERRLAAAADALDAARSEAAPRFGDEVSAQMARLEMGTAALEVSSERLPREQWGRQGPSRVEFQYRPGGGMSARPLRKIASGGEVSRVMLALKVVLGESDSAETLVFDEVDAGVGGATAVALAAVLADLASTHQVIVVTHLAQVASVADEHYLVSKTGGDVPETTIEEISGDERVREIARMLSGQVTDASLAHARELLSND